MTTTARSAPATPADRPFGPFFLIAAFYDLLLGVAFFVAHKPIFGALGVAPPDQRSYVHLLSAFVAVQGLGYLLVWHQPRRNVDLVKVGTAYKAAYVGTALAYLLAGDLPHNVFAWFAVADVAFLVGFVRFLATVPRPTREQGRPAGLGARAGG